MHIFITIYTVQTKCAQETLFCPFSCLSYLYVGTEETFVLNLFTKCQKDRRLNYQCPHVKTQVNFVFTHIDGLSVLSRHGQNFLCLESHLPHCLPHLHGPDQIKNGQNMIVWSLNSTTPPVPVQMFTSLFFICDTIAIFSDPPIVPFMWIVFEFHTRKSRNSFWACARAFLTVLHLEHRLP